jgi:molybdate transport system substrate-binding protein
MRGISSMATRLLLAELCDAWKRSGGADVSFESVGGVDAARRVADGEAFDLVVLAADAVERLIASGRVVAGSRVDLVRSGVALAVRSGAPHPDIGSLPALRQAVLAARRIGHSTGPSGVALLALFDRWGIAAEIQGRIVQAPPGVPVGAMVARGDVEIGFQQLSELMHEPGIDIVGPMPPDAPISTVFSGALCAAATEPDAARELLAFMAAPAAAQAKRRHGMDPA